MQTIDRSEGDDAARSLLEPAHAGPTGGSVPTHHHPVVFYDRDEELYDTVAGMMLAQPLRAGDTVVVVATATHRAGFEETLRAAGVDLAQARVAGRYVEIDAAELLATVSTDGQPDAVHLERVVGEYVALAARGHGRLHVFGEMVALLWEQDLAAGALELEAALNRLLAVYDFDLVCAYPTSAFPDGPATSGFVEVCAGHSELLGRVDGLAIPSMTDDADLTIRELVWEQLGIRDQMLDAVDAAVVAMDLDGTVQVWNEGARALHGWTAREAIGQSIVELTLPVDQRDAGRDTWDSIVAAGGWEGQLEAVRPDGTRFPAHVRNRVIRDDDGRPVGVVGVAVDMTEQVERERKLRVDAHHAHWMARIQAALDHDRFVLHAQPIVDLRTGAVVQHELLIRLDDPDEGLIAPGAFLPTAESYGLAPAIDRWVVGQAVHMAAAGQPVEVNLSARSFSDPTLPYLIRQLLDETGADPTLLVFELTETAMLDNEQDAARFAERIRAMGCQLALDDFGTGYGAFIHLKHLPVNLLKIDMEFVRDAVSNPASRHVIGAVVTLARSLDIRTVAEGVEDQATLELLADLGVDQAQGFHLGRPVPAELALRT